MLTIVLKRLLSALLLIAVFCAMAGCGSESHASASGTVTLNGLGLKHRAVLTFVGADHMPRSTETDDSGSFHIADLPPGTVTVTVSSIPDGGPASRPLGGARDDSKLSNRMIRKTTIVSEVPVEYGDATRPLLQFILQQGENPLQVDLTKRSK